MIKKTMKICGVMLATVCVLLGPKENLEARSRSYLPQLHGATLLIGAAIPFVLTLTTPNGAVQILPEANQPPSRDYTPLYQSISRDGTLIATARFKVGGYPRQIAIAIYSISVRPPMRKLIPTCRFRLSRRACGQVNLTPTEFLETSRTVLEQATISRSGPTTPSNGMPISPARTGILSNNGNCCPARCPRTGCNLLEPAPAHMPMLRQAL